MSASLFCGVAYPSVGIHVFHRGGDGARHPVAEVSEEEVRKGKGLEQLQLYADKALSRHLGREEEAVARLDLAARQRGAVEHQQYVLQLGTVTFESLQLQVDGTHALAVAEEADGTVARVQVLFPHPAGECHGARVAQDEGVEGDAVAVVPVDVPSHHLFVEHHGGVVDGVTAERHEGVVVEIEHDDAGEGEEQEECFQDKLPCGGA